jgi:uncharacterized LabA/DUF88 family protein
MAKVVPPHGIAIFIDFENLVTRTGVTDETFDLQVALEKLADKGRVVFQRAYCNWERFPAARQALHEKGVELIDVPPSTRSGKNGADIRLVVDALELCYQREHVDTFAILSGDSDFCPLAYKLRENNRIVIGMAMRDSTSPLLVKACDDFIFLKAKAPPRKRGEKAVASAPTSIELPFPTPQPPPAQPPRPPRRARGREPAATPPATTRKTPTVPDIVREVVADILGRATGSVNPSAIKSAIVRRQADFDVRAHGFSTFGRMLEVLEKEGLLRRQQTTNGQWNVLPSSS